MNNTDLFDGYAKAYTTGRPDYARKLIDHMYDTYGIYRNLINPETHANTAFLTLSHNCRAI